MINLKVRERYRLIGVKDAVDIQEDSVIEITGIRRENTTFYMYSVITGIVMDKTVGGSGHFSEDSRMHAYCVPIGLGDRLLPELKRGDYIINRAKGSKAWQFTEDYLALGYSYSFSNMRYAYADEIKEKLYSDKDKFKEGDIVVFLNDTASLRQGSIVKVSKMSTNYVYSNDFSEDWQNYSQDKFRLATPFEMDAHKHGYRILNDWKSKLEREAISRFPSPTSLLDVYGRRYTNLRWEALYWEDNKLSLGIGTAVVYYAGKWATPETVDDKGYKYRHYMDSLSEVHKHAEQAAVEQLLARELITSGNNGVGKIKRPVLEDDSGSQGKSESKGFNEEEYLSNPMNKRMHVATKRISPIKVHYRIKF